MAFGNIIQERMTGWIRFHDEGIQHPFGYSLRAFTPKFYSLRAPRVAKGEADFPGYHDNVPVEGSLKVYLTGPDYNMHFTLKKYGKVNLRGHKSYSLVPWRLHKSLITLPYKLFDVNDKEIGDGVLVYRRPIILFPVFDYKFLREKYAYQPHLKQAEKLSNLLNLLFPTWNKIISRETFIEHMEYVQKNTPAYVHLVHKNNYFLLQTISLLRFFKPIQKLSQRQASKLEARLKKLPLANLTLIPTITMMSQAIYTQDHYLKEQKQNLITPPKQIEKEPWMQLNMTPQGCRGKEPIEVDVVIIGSGAGGAPVAYELARQGHAVAVVEQGKYFKRDEFNGKQSDMMFKMYRRNGMDAVVSNAGFWIPQGVTVGGTTTVYDGTYFPTPEKVYERWRNELGLHDVDLEPFRPQVEEMLNVQQTPESLFAEVDFIVKDYAEKNGLDFHALLRNVDNCDGQGVCVAGCPTDAKRGTNVSYMPAAMKENAFLFSQYKVNDIIFEHDKAVGVRAGFKDYGPEFDIEIRAKVVVLAAGALSTPALLRKNIGKRAHLGKHLTIHPLITLGGIFDREMRPKGFVPQASSIPELPDVNYMLEGYSINPDVIPLIMCTFGFDLCEMMENAKYYADFSNVLADVTEGKLVYLPGSTDPLVSYFLDKQTTAEMKHAAARIIGMFFDAGAKSVCAPIKGFSRLTDKEEALKRLEATKIKPHHLGLSAYHALGTCRMGDSPKNSVVSPYGEVWGKQNLFVTDASAIPGPIGVNPQGTIMPNALRIANYIHETVLTGR